jgi:2-polyprenyl-6-methoxyphenol hydroxylase-like FAD-dependent oxidoreductase
MLSTGMISDPDAPTNGCCRRSALARNDSFACVSLLAGQGSILGIAEAYVLAGELRNCGGDYVASFAHYEQRLMALLKRKQKSAAKFASSFAPKTAMGIAFRNLVTRLMVRLPFVVEFFIGRENAGSGPAPRLWVLTEA